MTICKWRLMKSMQGMDRIFGTESIQQYFEGKSWYQGTTDADHFSDSVFSSVENQNIQFLLKKMGLE